MTKNYILMALIALSFGSCGKKCCDEENIVSQRYIHKYGYAVSKDEWEAKKFPGQVITTLKNGSTITSSYENGILNGPSTQSFPHSQIVESYFLYNNGSLVKEIKYDTRGMPVRETLQLSLSRYTTTLWYNDGTPMSIEEYMNDELIDGQYFTVTNELESRIEKGTGLRVCRDQKGLLVSKDHFEGGFLAKKEVYYPTGTPESIAFYQRGKLSGEKRAFTENGEPLVIEEYVDGKLHGKSTYFKNGSKSHEISFIEGQKNGKEVHYCDGETLSQEISWEDDVQHGACTYYIDGEPSTKFYYQGQIVTEKRFKEMNRLDDMISRIPDEVMTEGVR